MTYNESDIMKCIKKRKRDFLIKILCWSLLLVCAAALCAILRDITAIFISVAVIIISVIFLIRALRHYHPRILFSKEIRGTNIKEHEFAVTNMRPTFSARIVMPRRKTSAFAGTKVRTKSPTSAIVYLKLESGDLTYIDGLTNAQTDIYEIGDTLYKYPGTRYPIILGREVKIQPCPLCGTANRAAESECITCGLEINH